MSIAEEAEQRYPLEWASTSDEAWGKPPLESPEREAFIAGAQWALVEATEAMDMLHDQTQHTGAFGIHLVRKAIHALTEGES